MPAHYRHDGVRIQHDPYSPGMAEKYGTPGNTDDEGFDPYADSVGAGIYGGRVKRDASNGAVVIGAQYQNHNTRPGPVYAGGGYTPVSAAIASFAKELRSGEADSEDTTTLGKLLHAFPDLVNDVSTGGATPLHTCGMSQTNQLATEFIIEKGGDIEALDTYGYTPLDRMASNNLAVGARALIAAGADPRSAHGQSEGPRRIARSSEARDVLRALDDVLRDDVRHSSGSTIVTSVRVFSSTRPEVDGLYVQRDGTVSVPVKFAEVCLKNGWDVDSTWSALNGGAESVWFAHSAGETKNPLVRVLQQKRRVLVDRRARRAGGVQGFRPAARAARRVHRVASAGREGGPTDARGVPRQTRGLNNRLILNKPTPLLHHRARHVSHSGHDEVGVGVR
jgi:hypothetical protein